MEDLTMGLKTAGVDEDNFLCEYVGRFWRPDKMPKEFFRNYIWSYRMYESNVSPSRLVYDRIGDKTIFEVAGFSNYFAPQRIRYIVPKVLLVQYRRRASTLPLNFPLQRVPSFFFVSFETPLHKNYGFIEAINN